MTFPRLFASIVHDLRTNNVNLYVSKIYPDVLIFRGRGGTVYTDGAHIWNVDWVTNLGALIRGRLYTGRVLMVFYGNS